MKKLVATLYLFCLFFAAMANGEHEFIAFSVKGKVEYQAPNAKTWQIVTTKTAFYKGGTLRLDKGAEIVVLHKNYKTLKLTEKGNHSIDKLTNEAAKKPTDESTAYLQFIWKEFNKKNKNAESYHTDYMQTKGGVDRGDNKEKPLMLSPANTEKIFAPQITLRWQKIDTITTYTLVFFQNETEDMKLMEFEVKGNSFSLSAQTFWFRGGKTIYWAAYTKGNPVYVRHSFTILKEEEFNQALLQAQTLFEASEKTPMDAIKAGISLEENGMLQQAGQYYFNALQMANFADEYKILYSGWLARAGNIEEAQKWWVE